MNESIAFFEGPPSFSDLVDRVMRKYGCRVDEISLRGRFDCGKARAHYVLMKLASDANWKHYKDVVHEANVACLEDISMVHKAICESSMVNAEGTSVGESPVIKKGMKFNSLEELKFFLADYAVRLHRPFSVVHSDKNLRYNVMCKQGCHWRVWSRLISSTGQWRISNVPKREHVQCTAKYLGWRILGIIRKDSETSVPSLVEFIFAFSGYRGDWKESYGMVPRVLSAITYYNFGVKWCIDSCGMMHPDNGVLKHILQRGFWCFPQCSEAFQHCRPVILVDGTFLTGKYKGTLMMAVGVDPEQQLVPLAFALAESENNESWSWFMKLVRRHVLGPSRIVCMISDRHHGLLNCTKDHMDGFPPLVHRWCTRHFAANMSRRQKSNRVIGKLKILCKVHTEREFSEKLEDLVKDLNDDAKEWLKGEMEDKDKWAIGKVADDYLSEAELRSVHHLAEPYGLERMVYSIRSYGTTNIGGESHGGRHYRVDLNEVSCTCNVPQLLHLPCSHFITACKARGLNYESPLYMSPLYSREHTVKIWESRFQPYLDPSQWPAYEGVGYVPNPNLMRNKVGRRKKKRFTGDMDVSEGRLLTPDFVTSKIDAKKRRKWRSTVGNRPNGATVRDRPMTSVSPRVERAGVTNLARIVLPISLLRQIGRFADKLSRDRKPSRSRFLDLTRILPCQSTGQIGWHAARTAPGQSPEQ
uniref:SWIM-type domain-containing protein n=1 Tax=Setaria italica TaxID=4555 RepID=K3ZBZ3_SETIT